MKKAVRSQAEPSVFLSWWTMKRAVLSACLFGGSLIASSAFAENYAVLAGVNHYAWSGSHEAIDLQGPVNDVLSLREALLRRGFRSQNVHVLLDDQATRAGILDALASVVKRAGAGDQVVFFFSGHGTSGWDNGNPQLATDIGPDSGGLAPYDLNLTRANMFNTLVVGRRDLRPILSRLNPRATGIVILDACFSENSSKSIGEKGTPKYIDLASYLDRGLVVDDGSRDHGRSDPEASPPSGTQATGKAEPTEKGSPQTGRAYLDGTSAKVSYPYPNVISLAAASRDQTANDIGKVAIAQGVPTVDNLPHGAFTNSLLKGLLISSNGRARDSDSMDRLFHFAREDMRPRFNQTPQMLQPADATLAQQVAFGAYLPPPTQAGNNLYPDPHDATSPEPVPEPAPQPVAPPQAITRIRFSGIPDTLEERLLAIKGVGIGGALSDLILKYNAPALELYDGSGTYLRTYSYDEIDDLVERVAIDGMIRGLQDSGNWPHGFNLTVDVVSPERQGAYYAGQQLSIVGGTRQKCYPLAFDIDPNGMVNILTGIEDGPLQPNNAREMYKGFVSAPFGSDTLVLFGFAEKPKDYERWLCRLKPNGIGVCPQFRVGSSQYAELVEFLQHEKSTSSHAVLRVATAESPPQKH